MHRGGHPPARNRLGLIPQCRRKARLKWATSRNPGFLHMDPDAQMKTWQMADIDTGLAVGGAKLPWETYFTYGTPSPLSLDQHIEKFAHFGPGADLPEAEAAVENMPEEIEHSRAVAGAPA